MEQEKGKGRGRQRYVFRAAAVSIYSALLIIQPAMAADETLWTKFSGMMSEIYGELLGVSMIVAVTAATNALLVRMISRNQRAVENGVHVFLAALCGLGHLAVGFGVHQDRALRLRKQEYAHHRQPELPQPFGRGYPVPAQDH